MIRRWLALAVMPLGCLDTGQQHVSLPLYLAGTAIEDPFVGDSGWTIELQRADLAFGPLYLCAGFQAGELCETARLEWTESAVVDALRADALLCGELRGVTGPVRSWMYDLGITSLLTSEQPLALTAANELRGNSVIIEGVARREARDLPFRAELAIRQEESTEIGVPIVRKSGSDVFEHDVTSANEGLRLRFDPRTWASAIDFESLVENGVCAPGSAAVVCAGDVERTCASDGSALSERNCSGLGLICLRGEGCAERVVFGPNSQGQRAVRAALVAGERPRFEWIIGP